MNVFKANFAISMETGQQSPLRGKRSQIAALSLPKAYTAREIAKALGYSVWAVRKALKHIQPTCQAIVRGQKATADAWGIADIPERMRGRLSKRREELGLDVIGDLFRTPPGCWGMPIAWKNVPPSYRRDAEKLREALAEMLPLQHKLPAAELQERGLLEYRRVFGVQIDPRKWRVLFDRTVKRDCAQEDWRRIDIYIDPRAFKGKPAVQFEASDQALHRCLDEVIANLENSVPTADDRAWLKDSVFRHYDVLATGGTERQRRRVLASLIHYLYSALPSLSNSEPSLRRWFTDNYNGWVKGGRTQHAVEDRRRLKSGNFRERLCKDCRDLLIGGAVDLDGNLAQAWRRLQSEKKLCARCSVLWAFDPQHKSYVPTSIREDVASDVQAALALRRGPRYARSVGPRGRRDWGQVAPCEVFSADDVTWNHPFWYLDGNGKVCSCRGECLLLTDERTGYIIHYLLIAGMMDAKRTSYTGWHIRQLFLAGHDRFGLPHWGYSLENGIWRSRFIAGEKRQKWTECRWSEAEAGLQEQGLDLRLHYHLPGQPWTKPIERVIGMVQDRMGCEPFYVGRNERTDGREKTKELLRKVREGAHPADVGMRSIEQFRAALDAIISQYNSEVQNGDMLRDSSGRYLSPQEALQKGICGQLGIKDRPLKQLSATSRALLATHKRRCYVGDDGLEITINKTRWPYWGEALAEFKHKHIWAYLNFDCPEVLVCSDEDRQKYFTLKAKVLPARAASREQMEEFNRERGAFMRGAKVLHSRLPHPFVSTVTHDQDGEERIEDFGAIVEDAVTSHESEEDLDNKLMARIRRNCKLLGRPFEPSQVINPQTYLAGQEFEIETLNLNKEDADA